ncbi:MAG TPA: OmpH family outer membrane protein [Acidobacteriota bacterium]|jgi:outer membrane protein
MIKKLLTFCAAYLMLAAAGSAQAPAGSATQAAQQKPAGPAPTKLGFIESLRVVYETDEGKNEISKVQEFINRKQSEYDAKKADLDKLSEQYQNQQRNLNPETRSEMEKTVTAKTTELKRFQEDTQAEIDRQRDAILGKLGQKIQTLIDDYARENGYGVIFVRGQEQTYVNASLDITDEIIKRYNQKYPAPKTTTPPASPPPAQPKKP